MKITRHTVVTSVIKHLAIAIIISYGTTNYELITQDIQLKETCVSRNHIIKNSYWKNAWIRLLLIGICCIYVTWVDAVLCYISNMGDHPESSFASSNSKYTVILTELKAIMKIITLLVVTLMCLLSNVSCTAIISLYIH